MKRFGTHPSASDDRDAAPDTLPGGDRGARRVTDQIDPYALIDRAERLLDTDPRDAVMFALRAQSVARARGAAALTARAHYVAGAALTAGGDWSGAIRQLAHAEQIYGTQGDVASQCRVILQRAAACTELGEHAEALDALADAERLARRQRDHGAVRQALLQSADLHALLVDYSAARECVRAALELPSGTGADEAGVAQHFGLIDAQEGLRAALVGDAATVTRCMADAEQHFSVALELLAGSGDRAGHIAALMQRGAARCWLGRYDAGLADLEEAAAEAARRNFRLREVQATMEQGYHLVAAGRDAEGVERLRTALVRAEEQGDLRRPSDMHQRLAALFEARGDYRRALGHHKQYAGLKARLDARLAAQRMRLHETRAELGRLRASEARGARAQPAQRGAAVGDTLSTDALTGLPNRRSLVAQLEDWCARAHAGQLRFGLVVVDVDGFRRIIERHSHAAGDAVLREVARIVRSSVRGNDFAARLGGDTFVLLLADSEGGAARTVVERLLASVQAAQWQRAEGLAVTVSAGLAESTDFGDSGELWRRAEDALLAAKTAGGARAATWGEHA